MNITDFQFIMHSYIDFWRIWLEVYLNKGIWKKAFIKILLSKERLYEK